MNRLIVMMRIILLLAYGLVARICQKAAQLAREKGIKVGVIRPIHVFPFHIKLIMICR